jgi:hypothetical protein
MRSSAAPAAFDLQGTQTCEACWQFDIKKPSSRNIVYLLENHVLAMLGRYSGVGLIRLGRILSAGSAVALRNMPSGRTRF